MNEKVFRTMGLTGGACLALGIVTLVVGTAVGVISVLCGARLIRDRKGLMF